MEVGGASDSGGADSRGAGETQPPQRSEPGALTPTPFPTPLVSIQTAPAAPEPGATVAGALGLLGKAGLFPNLTGLDQTQTERAAGHALQSESAKHYADKACATGAAGGDDEEWAVDHREHQASR